MICYQIRKAKPKLYSDLGEDTQVTVVSASVSNKMLTKLSREITVCHNVYHHNNINWSLEFEESVFKKFTSNLTSC